MFWLSTSAVSHYVGISSQKDWKWEQPVLRSLLLLSGTVVYWVLLAAYFLVILRSSCDGSITLNFVCSAVARFASRRPCLRISTACVEFFFIGNSVLHFTFHWVCYYLWHWLIPYLIWSLSLWMPFFTSWLPVVCVEGCLYVGIFLLFIVLFYTPVLFYTYTIIVTLLHLL